MRVHLPLPSPTTSSTAECAFATVERGLEAEGGATELGLPTFPSRRFVSAGGLTVVPEGLLEHALVDIADGRAPTPSPPLPRSTRLPLHVPNATHTPPCRPPTPTPHHYARKT